MDVGPTWSRCHSGICEVIKRSNWAYAPFGRKKHNCKIFGQEPKRRDPSPLFGCKFETPCHIASRNKMFLATFLFKKYIVYTLLLLTIFDKWTRVGHNSLLMSPICLDNIWRAQIEHKLWTNSEFAKIYRYVVRQLVSFLAPFVRRVSIYKLEWVTPVILETMWQKKLGLSFLFLGAKKSQHS